MQTNHVWNESASLFSLILLFFAIYKILVDRKIAASAGEDMFLESHRFLSARVVRRKRHWKRQLWAWKHWNAMTGDERDHYLYYLIQIGMHLVLLCAAIDVDPPPLLLLFSFFCLILRLKLETRLYFRG